MFTDPALTAAWACSWGRLSPACIYPDWLWLLPGLPLRHPIGPRVGCVGSLRGLGHRSATATAQGQGSCQPHSGPHPPVCSSPEFPIVACGPYQVPASPSLVQAPWPTG